MTHEGIKSTKQFSKTLAVFKTVKVTETIAVSPESHRQQSTLKDKGSRILGNYLRKMNPKAGELLQHLKPKNTVIQNPFEIKL
jgi:hypothetical protein